MTHPAIDLLREWFNRGQSGCKFASYLASQDPRLAFWIHLADVSAINLEDIEGHVDAAAADGDVALLVFPRISAEDEIVELAERLQRGARWSVAPRSYPERLGEAGRRALGLSIDFVTSKGARSGVMGFAPSGFMPVTRRAPFVTLALWGGGQDNHFFRFSPAGTVNMADVPTTLERERHDTMWSRSVSDTQRRLQDPRHDSVWLRKVAFCLSRSSIERHWPRASMTVEQLRSSLEQLPFAVERLVVYSEVGRLTGVVVSTHFEGLDEAERQRIIWAHLLQRFDVHQITPIEFVFTDTPQEDAENAD